MGLHRSSFACPDFTWASPASSLREIIDAILYLLRSGCAWRLLPHDLPPWKTVYHYFRLWKKNGIWERLHTTLREQVRQKMGREAQPSAGIIDSQSVKTIGLRGPRGYDAGKKIKGRKRHLLVDTQGFVLKAKVHPADIMDRDGVILLVEGATKQFPRLRHVWLDAGYNGRGKGKDWIETTLGWTAKIVQHPPSLAISGLPKGSSLTGTRSWRSCRLQDFTSYLIAGSSSERSPG
jgi:putative transposase